MSSRPELFPAQLMRRRRHDLGWTKRRLARETGMSGQDIDEFESGRRWPAQDRLLVLASVLGIPARELTNLAQGSETLADLRLLAGLDLAQTAELLSQRLNAHPAPTWRARLEAAESGRLAQDWCTPSAWRAFRAGLAEIYSVSPAVIQHAWDHREAWRTPPPSAQTGGDLRKVAAPRDVPSERKEWNGLNARQRTYLEAIFREDQQRENDIRLSQSVSKRSGTATQWRKIPFSIHADPAFTGYTAVQDRLREAGQLDSGAGATLRALQRRGLLSLSVDEVEVVPLGFVPQTRVELTRRGRATTRAGLEEPTRPRRPAHLLSEWLWKTLVTVAKAGQAGLPADQLVGKPRFFLGTGYRPQGRPSRGYIDLVVVDGSTRDQAPVAERRWMLTERGHEHISTYRATYREWYPNVAVNLPHE
ncbi:helix-turn-helix transcriptional regulator [Saccharopolyspora shandongensis]|uniref:helix-turn-helix domain-containing protein n=1 Tax=Saccharopolyspora shandongensis TaxID=418495 RepID=UPI003443CEF1